VVDATGSFVISDLTFFIYHFFGRKPAAFEKVIDSADDEKCQMENGK